MKTLISAFLICISLFVNAQDTVSSIDFYEWNGSDNTKYSTIIILFNIDTDETYSIVRVKYTMEGLSKMVEYPATFHYEIDEYGFTDVFFMGDETATFLKGSGSYTPDNFLITIDTEGNVYEAYQADHNELDKGEEAIFADLISITPMDANHLRELIKEFFTSSDSIYRDLMLFAAEFD